VRNEEVLLRVKEQRNILHEICKRRADRIGHILRRNCLLQQVIEGEIKGEIEVRGRRGRRRRKLLDDLKERRGYSHLKEEALDHTVWRASFGRGFGPVVRQTTERMTSHTTGCPLQKNITVVFTPPPTPSPALTKFEDSNVHRTTLYGNGSLHTRDRHC
jgi:hypothetical protein